MKAKQSVLTTLY